MKVLLQIGCNVGVPYRAVGKPREGTGRVGAPELGGPWMGQWEKRGPSLERSMMPPSPIPTSPHTHPTDLPILEQGEIYHPQRLRHHF